MKKNTNIWKDEEVYTLFKFVEKFKTNNQPLLKAFELFANEYKRKKNSVRNFYYLKLKEFEKNPILAQKLNINLIAHTKTEQKFFTIEETELSMNKINSLLKKGCSVRRACLEVARGNIKEMLRLQNKYRSLKLKNKFHDCFITIKNSRKQLFDNNSKFQQKTSNILQMPNRNNPVLTDEEIKSLFMGLVNLVKKSAIEQFDKKIYKQLQDANFELRKSIKNLVTKEQEYLNLRKKFDLLSNEQNKLKEEITILRTQNATLLSNNFEKINSLKKYLKLANNNPKQNSQN